MIVTRGFMYDHSLNLVPADVFEKPMEWMRKTAISLHNLIPNNYSEPRFHDFSKKEAADTKKSMQDKINKEVFMIPLPGTYSNISSA